MGNIKELIRSLDVYGDAIKFSVDNKDKFKTFPGGIFTIMNFLLYLALLVVNIIKYHDKEAPNIYNSDIKGSEIRINNTDYIFSVVFGENESTSQQDTILKYYSPITFEDLNHLFELELIYITKHIYHEKTYKFIDCKNSNYRDMNLWNEHNISFCPDIPDKDEFLINNENYFKLNIKFTNASLKDYEKIFGNETNTIETYFTFFIKKNIFHFNDYPNPIENQIFEYSFLNSINLHRHLILDMKKMIVETEVFDVLKINTVKESFGISNIINDFTFKNTIKSGQVYFTTYFLKDPLDYFYKRTYMEFFKIFFEALIYPLLLYLITKQFYVYFWSFKYKCFLFNSLTVNDEGANNKEYVCDDKDLPRNLIVEEEICKNFYEKNSLEKNLKLGIKKESKYVGMNYKNQSSKKSNPNTHINLMEENSKINEANKSNLNRRPSKSIFKESSQLPEGIKSGLSNSYFGRKKKEEEEREGDNGEEGEGKGEELYLKRNYILIGKQIKSNPTIVINNTYIDKAYTRLTKKKDKTKYSFCSFLFYRKKNGNTYNAIEEFSKIFTEKFNIFFYFEKMKDIDLIKKFLFEKSQLKLMELISKKCPFSINTVNQNATNFKVDKLITKEELREIISSIDFVDKLNKNILDEMFQFTENLRR
jgi:hypothetical protein